MKLYLRLVAKRERRNHIIEIVYEMVDLAFKNGQSGENKMLLIRILDRTGIVNV